MTQTSSAEFKPKPVTTFPKYSRLFNGKAKTLIIIVIMLNKTKQNKRHI